MPAMRYQPKAVAPHAPQQLAPPQHWLLLTQGVYLGFAQLERIRDEFNLRELWEGDEIKEDLLIDTRMPRTEVRARRQRVQRPALAAGMRSPCTCPLAFAVLLSPMPCRGTRRTFGRWGTSSSRRPVRSIATTSELPA